MTDSSYRRQLAPFAHSAARFHALVLGATQPCLPELLSAIADLYAEGLKLKELPMQLREDCNLDGFQETQERQGLEPRVNTLLGDLQYYWAIFDPSAGAFAEPPEPTVGDLIDDVLDIHSDIVPGLRAYETGNDALLGECHFAWGSLAALSHWGQHAVSAMQALNYELNIGR